MVERIKDVIMRRDSLSSEEADQQIAEACDQLRYYLKIFDYDSAFDICEEFFALEPDYLDELIAITKIT